MSVWQQYEEKQRKEYIEFLKLFGALSELFRQKQGQAIPHLDSKFQETIYAKAFDSKIVDIGNTPHDILSIVNSKRIGIGIKTWMNSKPSYQKVMQLKKYQKEINSYAKNKEKMVRKISELKNEKLRSDYKRLGLSEDKNIYHFITRDAGKFVIHECPYILIELKNIQDIVQNKTSVTWSDGYHYYKYTYSDSQVWQYFDLQKCNSKVVHKIDVSIMKDPFSFLLDAFTKSQTSSSSNEEDIVEAYLPLYSYKTKEVQKKGGLNAWNAAPKNKKKPAPRPLNEVYIPIPKDFHKKRPNFFTNNILDILEQLASGNPNNIEKSIRFRLQLPNGEEIPVSVTQQDLKSLQSGSKTEKDINGKSIGQGALGQWLLIEVLGLKKRELVTKEWLDKKGTDSVRIWREKNNLSKFYIDFAPTGAFEAFMKDEPIPTGENEDNE